MNVGNRSKVSFAALASIVTQPGQEKAAISMEVSAEKYAQTQS